MTLPSADARERPGRPRRQRCTGFMHENEASLHRVNENLQKQITSNYLKSKEKNREFLSARTQNLDVNRAMIYLTTITAIWRDDRGGICALHAFEYPSS